MYAGNSPVCVVTSFFLASTFGWNVSCVRRIWPLPRPTAPSTGGQSRAKYKTKKKGLSTIDKPLVFYGASGRSRTGTPVKARDFK
ncbi:MAG: hypothetical protein ACKN9T_01030, partial [Candidatus Methylumidiphilus sp.]